jgi:hypothetical protein
MLLSAILYISQDQKEIVYALLTGIFGMLNLMAGYYWGSSEGSTTKNGIIKDLTEKSEGSELKECIAQAKKVAVEVNNQERKEAVEADNQERKEAKEEIV